MNRKIIMGCVFAVFMITAISLASAINSNKNVTERKDSPLFSIRTSAYMDENVIEKSSKFIGGESNIFIPPLQKSSYVEYLINRWTTAMCTVECTQHPSEYYCCTYIGTVCPLCPTSGPICDIFDNSQPVQNYPLNS